jgi:hypothetical protein
VKFLQHVSSIACAAGALGLMLTACGGSSGSAVVPDSAAVQSADGKAHAAQPVRFTIVVRKHRARTGRHPGYVSPSTVSGTITVGSNAPVIAGLTPASPGCSTTLPLTCTVTVLAPVGKQAFTVALFDAAGGTGHKLSEGTAIATVASGTVNRVTVVCNGVVAYLQIDLNQVAPPRGLSQTIALTVNALDADHNTIIAPGVFDQGPVTVADSDTTHTHIEVGTGAAATSVSVSGPGLNVKALYDGSSALASATYTASMPGAPGVAPVTATLTPVAAQIVIDAANGGPAISRDLIGANLPVWYDQTQSFVEPAFADNGMHFVRWPGGSFADLYHWGSGGSASACNGGYFYPGSTFDNFMTNIAKPANLDVAITVNYGSDATCAKPGQPSEAAAWVAYAKSHGDAVKAWTVGNENYGSWEYDLHATPHDPVTYAAAMSGTSGYYHQMKLADPTASVGVVASGATYGGGAWDQEVLANAPFDFVEYHYYAQGGIPYGQPESDSYLLGQGITDFDSALSGLRTEMKNAGVASSVPIYLGELNSIVSTAGKQSVSITNGLFAGMAIAEVMKTPGVTMASWWLAFGDCETSGNFAGSLYGFQNFGTYTLFSDGLPNADEGCPATPAIPGGTPFPDGRAFTMLSQFAGQGSVMRNVVTAGLSTTNVRVYADTLGSGYGVLLFNLNDAAPVTYTVALGNTAQSEFTASQATYGKAQYDLTNLQPTDWTGAVTSSLGTVGRSFTVTLPAWSMNLVTLTPNGPDGRRLEHPKARPSNG